MRATHKKTIVVDFSAGSTKSEPMKELPMKGPRGPYVCTHVSGRMELTLVSAATSDAVTGRRMIELISRLTIGGDKANCGVQNLAGSSVRYMQRTLTGRLPRDPADIAANSNVTNTKVIRFVIPFADKRAESPTEQGIPVGYLAKGNAECTWAASTFFGTGQVITAASTRLVLTFHYVEQEDDEKNAPALVLYRQYGIPKFEGSTIDAGILTDLILAYKDGATEVGSDDYTNLSFYRDSEALVVNEDIDRHVDQFNNEMIDDAAAYAIAPEDSASAVVEEVPLVWPGKGYKLTKLPHAHQNFKLDLFQGSGPPTLSDLVLIERRVKEKTNDDLSNMWVAQGADAGVVASILAILPSLAKDIQLAIARPKTISKVPLSGPKGERIAAFLPARFDEAKAKQILAGMSNAAK